MPGCRGTTAPTTGERALREVQQLPGFSPALPPLPLHREASNSARETLAPRARTAHRRSLETVRRHPERALPLAAGHPSRVRALRRRSWRRRLQTQIAPVRTLRTWTRLLDRPEVPRG